MSPCDVTGDVTAVGHRSVTWLTLFPVIRSCQVDSGGGGLQAVMSDQNSPASCVVDDQTVPPTS